MYVFHIFQFEVRINSFYCEADAPKLSSLFSTADDFSSHTSIFSLRVEARVGGLIKRYCIVNHMWWRGAGGNMVEG